MSWPVPLPPATGDEVADLAAFAAWEVAVERVYHPDRFGGDGERLPVPRTFEYYLGIPEASWLGHKDDVSKFISATRLDRLVSRGDQWPHTAVSPYAIDSGAYMALTNTKNRGTPWWQPAEIYASKILSFATDCGRPPDFVATQDWPCEPTVRKMTGMSVREHQRETTDNYLFLTEEWPWIEWMLTFQGWEAEDYRIHELMYLDAGVDITRVKRVGIGSICRRGHVPEIVEVIEQFAESGYALHGFGIKITALPIIGHLLRSADSMAWSYDARYPYPGTRLDGCTHPGNCANCYRYAVQWRERVLASLLPKPEEVPVSIATEAHPLSMRFPAALRVGDVFIHPDRGQLTLVAAGVASSARPTVAKLTVQEGDPVEIDAFDGFQVQIVSRGSVDPLFAGSRKGSEHLFVPLTYERSRCGECGDTNTPNHVPAVGKRPPTKKKPALAADLFAGMAEFAALVTKGLTPAVGPRTIPLGDAEWGMYGTVKGYGPDGDRRTETGYITMPPRITTRGFSVIFADAKKKSRKGDRLWWFTLSWVGGCGGTEMHAEEGTTFTVLEAPADQPLTVEKSLSFRTPIFDLRRGEVFHIWDEPGHIWNEEGDRRPRYHVQADPVPAGGGHVDVVVLVDGQVITRRLNGETWADVDDPEVTPWQQAHAITTYRIPGSGERGWFGWSCLCGAKSDDDETQWSHADLAQSMGERHAQERANGQPLPLAPAGPALKRPAMSGTYVIDQSKIDAPDFPRDFAWWRGFVAEWMGPEMLPDGTVLLTASGSAAQAKALGGWIETCASGRLAGAYRRLTRQEAKDTRALVQPVFETPMLFDLDAMGEAVAAALAEQAD